MSAAIFAALCITAAIAMSILGGLAWGWADEALAQAAAMPEGAARRRRHLQAKTLRTQALLAFAGSMTAIFATVWVAMGGNQ